MKNLVRLLPVLAIALFCTQTSFAQAPAGAPSGATGQCKDLTYSTAAAKSGACGGHKGVKTWWAAAPGKATKPAPAAAPADKHLAGVKYSPAAAAPAAKPAPAAMAPKPAAAMPPASAGKPAMAAAPGGGPGMVWVNSSTKVYHCPGDRYYGKTKAGSYMTEAAAKSAGYKADANKPCK